MQHGIEVVKTRLVVAALHDATQVHMLDAHVSLQGDDLT